MYTLLDYEILDQIYDGSKTVIYRAVHPQTEQRVILKKLKSEYPALQDVQRLKREYEMGKSLYGIDGIVKVLDLIEFHHSFILVMEDIGGESLQHFIPQKGMSPIECLNIAIQLTQIIGQLHQKKIVHKDIKPKNIIYQPASQLVKVTDLGISSPLMTEQQTFVPPLLLEGTLSYMSPEQTGRMNRMIDYRADFYSLGVTLYELLTGELPFSTTDPVELIHCHIARIPTPAYKKCSPNARILSDIIMKCMAKNAEDRYQSAYGLSYDLEQCLELYTQSVTPSHTITLGTQDRLEHLQIPQHLYGRELELEWLNSAYQRIQKGKVECIFVVGYAGVGKSSLVNELHRTLTQGTGSFIQGKFDQLKQHIPCNGLIMALKQMIRMLLTERKEVIEQRKMKILDRIGNNGHVLIDVLPELEIIIGKQPSVEALPPTENQNRFHYVLRQFIQLFCTEEQPLVMFLDDLHWADSSSLRLIEALLSDPYSKHLLVIGAYREQEVNQMHSLYWFMEELKKHHETFPILNLQPLRVDHVAKLLGDTFRCSIQECHELAHLLVRKTLGNPFFIRQFLPSLYDQGLIFFDYHTGKWQWNIETISSTQLTENTLDFIADKLVQLPEDTQYLLSISACCGFTFNLKVIASLEGSTLAQAYAQVWPALEQGYIMPIGTEYKFITGSELYEADVYFHFHHDRIQEILYSLIPQQTKERIHYQIGQYLLASISTDQLDEQLFEVVNHLNKALPFFKQVEVQINLIELNLQAAKKAKKATAYHAALSYLQQSTSIIREEWWSEYYQLMISVYMELAEAEYLVGNFDTSERLFIYLLERCHSEIDQAELYNLMVILNTTKGRHEQAVRIGIEGLKLFGIHLSTIPKKSTFLIEFMKTKFHSTRRMEAIYELPILQDPRGNVMTKLMANLSTSSYFTNPDLYALLMLKLYNFFVRNGNADASSIVYNAYGLILGSIFGRYDKGLLFGEVGLRMSEKFNHPVFRCKCNFTFGVFLNHWRQPIHSSIPYLQRSYQSGIEGGDLVFASYAVTYVVLVREFKGDPLVEVYDESKKYQYFNDMTKNRDTILMLDFVQRYCNALRGLSPDPCIFGVHEEEERQLVQRMEQSLNLVIGHVYYFKKMFTLYLHGRAEEALQYIEPCKRVMNASFGLFHTPEQFFYTSLILLAQYSERVLYSQYNWEKELRPYVRKLKHWAEHSPSNYGHMHLLVQAEILRVKEDYQKAIHTYELAIQAAKKNEFIHHEALCYELTAKCYLEQDQEKMSRIYMTDAYYTYLKWGAVSKVQHLEKHYSHLLLTSTPVTDRESITSIGTQHFHSTALDFDSVVKASQTISGEIVHEQLLTKLMRTMIHAAGAQRGVILIADQEKLYIEAEGVVLTEGKEQIEVLESVPLESYSNLPSTLIFYTYRTKDPVVLDSATGDPMFGQDPYILENKPQSLFCIPIINQGQLLGMVYLENKWATGAFTSHRLKVLEILSSQAAISIHNARLYTHLEDKVKERTDELARLEKSRRDLISNISHDLGTPLTSIRGYVEAILDGIITDEHIQRKYLKVVHTRIIGIDRLIHDLFDLTKLESRKVQFKFEAIRVDQCLLQLFPKYELDAENAGIRCVLDIPVADPEAKIPLISVDIDRIDQVLSNLMVNALRYTPQGGSITLFCQYPTQVDGEVIIGVRDTGSGIAAQDLPYIFDRFYRATTSRGTSTGQRGLGLAICKEIIEYHRGKMHVASVWGQGSSFTFTLPEFRTS